MRNKLIMIIIIFFAFKNIVSLQENNLITEERIDKIIKEAEAIRRLNSIRAIGFKLMNKNQIKDFIKEQIYREYSESDLKNEETFLKILGLVPNDFKLSNFYIELYTEQAAGIYDYASKSFYIADWMPDFLLDPVIFHEAIHALDDQHFNLQSYFNKQLNNDEKFARAAVIEGEGTYFMMKYLLNSIGAEMRSEIDYEEMSDFLENIPVLPQMEEFSKVPNFIKSQMLFPYIKGLSFIANYLKNHSSDDLSTLYENPPASTEQVMHPEKYNYDKPLNIKAKFTLKRKDWRVIYCNNVGEYSLSVILQEKLSKDVSQKAAEGWGGDSYCIIQKNNYKGLILKSLWDNSEEAKEFYSALAQWLNVQNISGNNLIWVESSSMNSLVILQGNSVVWLVGKIDRGSAFSLVVPE